MTIARWRAPPSYEQRALRRKMCGHKRAPRHRMLRMSLGLSMMNVGGYLAVNILGSFTGAFVNGFLADSIGRYCSVQLPDNQCSASK